MRICLYPGSFDPLTNGHMDIIERLSAQYDRVVVAVMVNPAKKPFLPVAQRVELISRASEQLGNVSAQAGQGFTVELARQAGAQVIARGLRSLFDYENEMQLYQANHYLCPQVETIFLPARPGKDMVSSTLVREIFSLGGDISGLVPVCVGEAMRKIKP